MAEDSGKRDICINLNIKSVSIAVKEAMPVAVVWSRGNKKATTKKRLLNENVSKAEINEKFQINTEMEVDETGKPCKSKMVSCFFNFLVSTDSCFG